MSFYLATCPAPIARTTYTRNGAVKYVRERVADESLWLDDFTSWAKTDGAVQLFSALEPVTTLGLGWDEIVEGYADDNDIALTDDDRSRIFNALCTAGGHPMDLAEGGLLRVATDAMVALVVHHARRAFDPDSEETALHAGEVVTGGVVGEYDDAGYPTGVFESVLFMADVPYFDYLADFEKTVDLDEDTAK